MNQNQQPTYGQSHGFVPPPPFPPFPPCPPLPPTQPRISVVNVIVEPEIAYWERCAIKSGIQHAIKNDPLFRLFLNGYSIIVIEKGFHQMEQSHDSGRVFTTTHTTFNFETPLQVINGRVTKRVSPTLHMDFVLCERSNNYIYQGVSYKITTAQHELTNENIIVNMK